MGRYQILLTCLLCVTGCTGEVWRVDSRFSSEEHAEIDKAAATWEAVGQSVILAHGHKVTGTETAGRYIFRATRRTAVMLNDTFRDHTLAGLTACNAELKMLILLPENDGITPFWQVSAHEMGHALGLDHVEDPKALMFRKGSEESLRCLTRVDILEMCRTAGCPGAVPKGCDE